MPRNLTAVVREGAEAFTRLAALAASADEIQWEASPRPRSREDSDRKAAGGHGDPTGDVALDPRRLAVREAMVQAERALEGALQGLQAARGALAKAVDEWHGDTDA